MVSKKKFSILNVALLVALVTSLSPIAPWLKRSPAQAQSPAPTTFALPTSVPKGTTVRVDGSSSMATINQALKQQFGQRFPDAGITIGYGGSPAALQAVADGKLDLAAIGRSLTAEERAKGLVALPVTRSKIAMIVGNENPFNGNLSIQQFAKIFRGEITDWSQVGGTPGPIRFIDRPDTNDTREAFRNYPVFREAEFKTGATATKVNDDSAKAVADQLGKDGISFVTANQLSSLSNVRAVSMHKTLPDDPRYPFSQPLAYVYKAGNTSPAIAAFLGYATSPEGQQDIEAAQASASIANGTAEPGTEDIAIAGNAATAAALLAAPTASPTASPDATASPNAAASPTASPTATATPAPAGGAVGAGNASTEGTSVAAAPVASTNPNTGLPPWLWWLLPLGLLAGLIWWLSKRKSDASTATVPPAAPPTPTVVPPPPPPIRPASDADIAGRAGTVINGDRASIAEVNGPAHSVEPPSTVENEPPSSIDAPSDPNLLGGAAIAGAGAAIAGAAWANRSNEPAEIASPAADEAIDVDLTSPVVSGDITPSAEPATDVEIVPSSDATVTPVFETGEAIAETTPADPESLVEAQTPGFGLDDAALLGGAGLAAGAAAWATRTGKAPTSEPTQTRDDLTSFDLIEEVEAVEAQLDSEDDPQELVLDEQTDRPLMSLDAIETSDAPTALSNDDATELAFDEVTVGEPEAPLTSLDAIAQTDDLEVEVDEEPTELFLEDASATPSSVGLGLTPGLAGGVAAAGAALVGAAGLVGKSDTDEQSEVEASKFNVGQTDLSSETLATVDEGLADLPDGYGESRIVLLPRDPEWAYTYWDIPNEHRHEVRQQGGQRLALRLYDVTDIDLEHQAPHSLQQYDCDELARDWYIPIPVSDRDYVSEIGYLTGDGRWLMLARSAPVRIPPVYPSDWFEDHFATVTWDQDLRSNTLMELVPPANRSVAPTNGIYDRILGLAGGAEAMRVAGSLFGSMQQVPQQSISSFVFPSGMGMWALPTPSGMGYSGMNMSGVGFSAAMPPIRPRKFWLVADAELIVYGATEPDANLTIAGQPVQLNPDGTFRFQLSFQDGQLDYPIIAVASDGEQTRSIHLQFTRETPMRKTNPKEDATEEWQM